MGDVSQEAHPTNEETWQQIKGLQACLETRCVTELDNLMKLIEEKCRDDNCEIDSITSRKIIKSTNSAYDLEWKLSIECDVKEHLQVHNYRVLRDLLDNVNNAIAARGNLFE